MPDDIWVTKVVRVDVEHWVALVGFESVSAVPAVGNGLVLSALDAAGVFSQRVNLQDVSVILVTLV